MTHVYVKLENKNKICLLFFRRMMKLCFNAQIWKRPYKK